MRLARFFLLDCAIFLPKEVAMSIRCLFQTLFAAVIVAIISFSSVRACAEETPPIPQPQAEKKCRKATKRHVVLICLPGKQCRWYMSLIASRAMLDPTKSVGRKLPGYIAEQIHERTRFTIPDVSSCVPDEDPDLLICIRSTHKCHFLRRVPGGKTTPGQPIFEIKSWRVEHFDVLRDTDFFGAADVFNEPHSSAALRITPEEI